MNEKEYLTTGEAATLLRLTERSVRLWVQRGYLVAYRVGKGSLRFKRADIIAALSVRETDIQREDPSLG